MTMSGVVDPRRSGGASFWIAQTNRNRSLPPSACFGRLLSTVVTPNMPSVHKTRRLTACHPVDSMIPQ
jgi:hypothetical protein